MTRRAERPHSASWRRCILPPRLLTLAISLYLISCLSFAPHESHVSATGLNAEPVTLTPSKPFAALTWRGMVHTFRVELGSNHFLQAFTSQDNVDLHVTLYDSGGRQLSEFVCLRDETTPISYIAEVADAYRFDVTPLGDPDGGSYKFSIGKIRAREERDTLRVAAAASQSIGARLLLEWREESLRRAFRSYEDALRFWQEAGERGGELYALRKLGGILRSLGELRESLGFFLRALKLSQELRDQREVAASLNDSGHVLLSLGRNQHSLRMFRKSLRLSRATSDRKNEARALNNIGEVFYALGDLPKSIEYHRQAQAICDEIGDQRGLAQALLNLGYSYSDLSETSLALEFYSQALRFWQRADDRRSEALTITALGHLHAKNGEKQKALSLYDQARRRFLELGEKVGEAFTLNGIGYVHLQLGQRERSLEYYRQALTLFREAGYREGEANSLKSLGDVSFSLGHLQVALNYYQQSLEAIRAMADRRLEPYALKGAGAVYEVLGEMAKARGFYERALSHQRRGGDKRETAYTLNSLALLDAGAGRWQEGCGRLQFALQLNRAAADPFGESLTLYNFARLERGRGNLVEARTRAEASLGIVESLRTKVASMDLRASYLASIHQQYEFYIDLLMLMHKERPGEGFDARALEVSERARARSLLEIMTEVRAGIRQGVNPSLLARERQLQQALNDKAARQMLLDVRQNKEAAAVLAKEIEQITAEYDSVRAQIRVTNPRYAALTQPQPLSLEQIQQQVLDKETILLEYSLGDERSYLWAVTQGEVTSYELPRRVEIEEAARNLYNLLIARQPVAGETSEQRRARVAAADEQYWEQAGVLADMLLSAVAGRLRDKRLLVVPDGALHNIPFEALPDPGVFTNGEQPSASDAPRPATPLILNHEIVNQPSASALGLLRGDTTRRRQTARKAVAVIADPVFERDDPRVKTAGHAPAAPHGQLMDTSETYEALRDAGVLADGARMPRLLASREEAEAIIAAAPSTEGFKAVGFDASRATATSADLGNYRIVHFATHGLLNQDHSELSGIVLSLVDEIGRPADGFLRLHDIYNLDLPVDLVVLSACSTGLGKDVRGEGVIGLTRGFMYAGAASVMASLWRVDDVATAELMGHFYRNLLQDGLPTAAALREAQIAMLRQRQWRAPYFWAAFVLQGEYSQRLVMTERPKVDAPPSHLIATSLTFFLAASGFFLCRLKRRKSNHV